MSRNVLRIWVGRYNAAGIALLADLAVPEYGADMDGPSVEAGSRRQVRHRADRTC